MEMPEKLPEKLFDLQKAIVLQMDSDPKVTYDQLNKTTKRQLRIRVFQCFDGGGFFGLHIDP